MEKRICCVARRVTFWLVTVCLLSGIASAQTSIAEISAATTATTEANARANRNVAAQAGNVTQNGSNSAAPASAATNGNRAVAFSDNAKSLEFSFSLLTKVLGMFVVVWMWVGAGDWVNRDCQIHRLGWFKWNPIFFFPFALAAVAVSFVGYGAVVRIPVTGLIFLVTWVPYVIVHNKNVEPHQTVLTGAWWRFVMATVLGKLGVKMSADRMADYEKGAAVDLFAMGSEDPTVNNANLISARNSPGYLLLKDLVVDMVSRGADKVMLDFTQQGVNLRYEIDGMWHNGEPREREPSDVMLAVMKTLANLNVQDRRTKQEGNFGAKYEDKSYFCALVCQGVSSGERVLLARRGEHRHFANYAELGMREGLREQWSQLMASDQGMVVLSTLPTGGLTTITDVSIEETDRLMRDFAAIEDVDNREAELQNVSVTTYNRAAGETPATILPKLVRTYPAVYICRDLVDAESAKILLNEVKDERLVITTIPAREAAEALLRLLQMKLPAKEFASAVKAVLYQRLVRVLCPQCKVGYTPPPDVLKKLGIPAGKIEQLFRPPKPEELEKPCLECGGLGYRGRTGIFELLVVNDQMREILVKQPNLDLLKKAARASRQRSLQEEGILLVAKGTTSLPELMRVLKQ